MPSPHIHMLLLKLVDLIKCSPIKIILRIVVWVRKIYPGNLVCAIRSVIFRQATPMILRPILPGGFDGNPVCTSPAVIDCVHTDPHLQEKEAADIITSPDTPTFAPLLSSPHGSAFFTTAPDPHFQRYDRNVKIAKDTVKMTLEPGTRLFRAVYCLSDVPVDWTAYIHPEGALYYVHNSMNIFTDSPLHEKPSLEIAMEFICQIEEYRSTNGILPDDDVDLVLDLIMDEHGQPACGYYLADHHQRIIFWYDAFDVGGLPRVNHVYGARSPHHIEIELTAQYWYHCSLFPSTLHVTRELVQGLRDTIVFSIGGKENCENSITAATSTVGYSVDDLLKMLTVVESLKENTETDYGGTACILSRFMWAFADHKFYNFHGEPCARLEKEKSVFGSMRTRSFLLRIFGPLLFNVPLAHLRSLEKIYVDEIAYIAPWRRIMDTLCIQWQEHILYATVLLNANVAFLTIPTVDNGEHIYARSASQISSYVSVIASLGSVIIGLNLVHQNRKRRDDEIAVAAAFLRRHFHGRFGLESLALLHSLPFVLLMWGTIAFLIAFLVMCFQSWGAPARAVVACCTLLVGFGVLWCFQLSPILLLQAIQARFRELRARLVWKRVFNGVAAV
ncbi:hypothetical protein B0H14DRAFT_3145385 [Mycena olivaceomarginata]|nr:hypothetical protein B0H14DRAFT_3145385 [Mycena olivaceomarginata]